jgi:flagellar hook assembly protein FlgD
MAVVLDLVGEGDISSLSQLNLTQGETICVNATLASPAADVTMEVDDANGSKVRTESYGAMAAGRSTEVWDGLNAWGVVEPSGTYSINLWATDISGNAVSVKLAPCEKNPLPE